MNIEGQLPLPVLASARHGRARGISGQESSRFHQLERECERWLELLLWVGNRDGPLGNHSSIPRSA